MMAALGVRNIAQFNERVEKALAAGEKTFRLRPKPGESEGAEMPYQRLPYIVVVIDELADLMVVWRRATSRSRSSAWRRWRAPRASTWCSRPSARASTS